MKLEVEAEALDAIGEARILWEMDCTTYEKFTNLEREINKARDLMKKDEWEDAFAAILDSYNAYYEIKDDVAKKCRCLKS